MLYLIPTLQSDHIETKRQWIDQCHYFKRTMTKISFNITYLQDSYLGTYVSMNEFMTDTQMSCCIDICMHPVFSFESK